MRYIETILNHAPIIFSLMYLTLFVIDKINSGMTFIDNPLTKALLLIFAVVSSFNSLRLISGSRARTRKKLKKAAKKGNKA